MSIPTRLMLGAAILAGVQLGALALGYYGLPREVSLRKDELLAMPMDFGSEPKVWTGKADDLDPRILQATEAQAVLNRSYHGPLGYPIGLHIAAFTDPEQREPHPPRLCYTSGGWREVNSKDIQIEGPGGRPAKVQLITFEKGSVRVAVLFWYQIGDRIAVESYGVRAARWAYRGDKAPPLIKVMLQAPATGGSEAEEQLKDLAVHVLAWTTHVGRPANP